MNNYSLTIVFVNQQHSYGNPNYLELAQWIQSIPF